MLVDVNRDIRLRHERLQRLMKYFSLTLEEAIAHDRRPLWPCEYPEYWNAMHGEPVIHVKDGKPLTQHGAELLADKCPQS